MVRRIAFGAMLVSTLAIVSSAGGQQESAQQAQPDRQQRQQLDQPDRAGQSQPGTLQSQQGGRTQVQRSQEQQPGRSRASGQQMRHASPDAQIAAWLIVDNEAEIALSQLAQQRAQHEQVKQFAQKMVEDHTQFIQKLQQTAGQQSGQGRQSGTRQQGRTGTTRSEQSQRVREADVQIGEAEVQIEADQETIQQIRSGAQDSERQQGQQADRQQRAETADDFVQRRQTQTTRTGAGGQDLNWVLIKREIGQRHLQSVASDLESKPAAEFDKCYMDQQVMAHQKMLDQLAVLVNHSSPEAQDVLREGMETTKMHLEQAKQIAEQVKKEAGADASLQRSSGQQRTKEARRPRQIEQRQEQEVEPRRQP